MLTRFFVGVGVVLVLGVVFLTTIVANARFTMPHPRDKSIKVLLSDHGAVLMPADGKTSPKVEVVETVYHFGRMDPYSRGEHAFEVRNIGTAPLKLDVASTTCKCTVGGVSANVIPPGQHAYVTLEWNTGYKFQTYSQSAEVRTNDPLRPAFNLEVEGKVRLQFGSEVEEMVVPSVAAGKSSVAEAVVYSQVWEEFEIQSVKTSLPDVSVQFLPLDSGNAKRLEAKAGRLMRVTVTGNMPTGEFRDVIRIKASREGSPQEVADFELPLFGKMLRRFSISGLFNEQDALLIGHVPQGAGKTTRLLLKLRDEDLALPIKSIKTEPSFLKVSIESHVEKDLATPALYDLVVEIPADAPVCQFMGNPEGSLRITTGHPRIPEISLQIHFAVAP